MHLKPPHLLRPHIPPLNLRWFVVLLVILFSLQLYFANKSWRTYQVLEGARVLGIESAADLRAHLTFGELITRYEIPESELRLVLGEALPGSAMTLREYAEQHQLDALEFIRDIQRIIPSAEVRQVPDESPSLYEQFQALILSWMAEYGLPVLVLVVFLGALGLPVPAGPVAALTGMLSFDGMMASIPTALAILISALLGDLSVYLIGRVANPEKLVRYGRFLGYTEANRARVTHLFERWGGLTLLMTRSLVAHISAVASLLAGSSRISYKTFLGYSLGGRTLWLFIYFGLGYLVGSDFAMASSFLSYISLFLICVLFSFLLIQLYIRQHPRAGSVDNEETSDKVVS